MGRIDPKKSLREWPLLLVLVILTRLVFVFLPGRWPGGDEALHGFLALDLSSRWKWDFFTTCGEHPPLLIWLLALWIRWTGTTLAGLWTVPAVFSILGWVTLTRGARWWMPPPVARLFAWLLALSLWPLWQSRFCHQGSLVLFFAGLALWGAARSYRATPGAPRFFQAFLAGLALGAGSLTFTAWLAVFPLAAGTALWVTWTKKRRFLGWVLPWGLGILLGFTPFLLAVFREGYGNHLLALSSFGAWTDPNQGRIVGASYITELLGGPFLPGGPYGPPLGGWLTPLLGAGFLLGLAGCFRHFRQSTSLGLFAALVLGLLPGALSRDYVESYRTILALPPALALSAWGLRWILQAVPRKRSSLALAVLLAVSGTLNLSILSASFWTKTPTGSWGLRAQADSPDRQAYLVFRDQTELKGPGWLLTDFVPLAHNHSLSTAVYPMNAALDPRFQNTKVSWVGVTAEPGYLRFLKARFPEGDWRLLVNPDGQQAYALGVLPLTSKNAPTLQAWKEAHDFFHGQNEQAEGVFASRRKAVSAYADLERGRTFVEGDPILLAMYCEWAAQYYWDPKQDRNVAFLRLALRKGVPARHLIRKYVALLREQGNRKEADRVQKAYFPNEPVR